ncbi:MAG: metallophosphoesterase [bacterium]
MHKVIKQLIIFVAITTVVFVAANIVTYRALVSVFRIGDIQIKHSIAYAFMFLSGGFIVMLFIEKKVSHVLVRILYTVTAVWTGVFVYLFFAAVLFDFSKRMFFDARVFGVFFFFVAIALGIYGVVHAKKIFIKKIQVSLPNLPVVWRGRTAVWVSDLHLGSIYQASFAKKVTDTINSVSPDIIFVGGDLYDGTHAPDPYAIAQPLQNLSSKLGTFYITGNHEEFGSAELFLDAIKKLGMNILQDEKIEIDGLQIVGVDYAHSAQKENFKTVLDSIDIDVSKPSILLKHEPRDLETAEQAGISLQISGHTHRGQQWPFNFLAQYVYKGYDYGLKNHGTMNVLVSSGVGGWGPPLRIGTDGEIVHITFI